jgi:predicted DNA-binding transcriptional regulator YafY
MNRIDRVTAISLRTVYRDIKTLYDAGIPLTGEAGVGYSIMEGFRLPPVMFTKEEATAFLTAEKLVEKLTDASTQRDYSTAMFKIKAVLHLSEKDYLEDMEKHIAVIENQYVPRRTNDTTYLQKVLQSIPEKMVLNIDYFANHDQQKTNRDVEPVGIYYLGEHWYLVGYCRLRKDYRTFKFGNINNLIITDRYFDQQHPSLKSFLSKVSKEKELHTVILLVDKNIIQYFGDQKFYNGFISQKDVGDKVEMTFLSASLNGFARWYMLFGDNADIISPQELKVIVSDILSSISKKVK